MSAQSATLAAALVIGTYFAIVTLSFRIDHLVKSEYWRNGILLLYLVSSVALLTLSTKIADELVRGSLEACGCMSLGIGVHYWGIYLRDLVRYHRRSSGSNAGDDI